MSLSAPQTLFSCCNFMIYIIKFFFYTPIYSFNISTQADADGTIFKYSSFSFFLHRIPSEYTSQSGSSLTEIQTNLSPSVSISFLSASEPYRPGAFLI